MSLSKLEYKNYTSPMGWYSMLYPSNWNLEVIEGIPAFYDPEEGTGAFQVYAFYNKKGEYDLTQELIRYLQTHGVEYQEDCVASFINNEGSRIKACEFISKERFWLVYVLAHHSKMVLCTYNSDENPDKKLSKILTNIISSIRFSTNNFTHLQ
ncbi:MAG: DUF3805 domain-containing protein [Leptospiraceae bacterium]|nr:DUF3805 domain-containing protein [Leptospiraceae bacterium]